MRPSIVQLIEVTLYKPLGLKNDANLLKLSSEYTRSIIYLFGEHVLISKKNIQIFHPKTEKTFNGLRRLLFLSKGVLCGRKVLASVQRNQAKLACNDKIGILGMTLNYKFCSLCNFDHNFYEMIPSGFTSLNGLTY